MLSFEMLNLMFEVINDKSLPAFTVASLRVCYPACNASIRQSALEKHVGSREEMLFRQWEGIYRNSMFLIRT